MHTHHPSGAGHTILFHPRSAFSAQLWCTRSLCVHSLTGECISNLQQGPASLLLPPHTHTHKNKNRLLVCNMAKIKRTKRQRQVTLRASCPGRRLCPQHPQPPLSNIPSMALSHHWEPLHQLELRVGLARKQTRKTKTSSVLKL